MEDYLKKDSLKSTCFFFFLKSWKWGEINYELIVKKKKKRKCERK